MPRDKKDLIKIQAVCPKCGKKHWKTLSYPWIGRGVPRFYCEEHKFITDTFDPVLEQLNICKD